MTDWKCHRMLLALSFHLVNILYAANDTEPLKSCHGIIEYRYQIKYDIIDTEFGYNPPFVCLLCTRQLDESRERLDLPQAKFPICNDFLEFGLIGSHYPKRINVQLKSNSNCQFEIDIFPNFKIQKISISIQECLISDTKQCFVLSNKILDDFSFDTWSYLFLTAAFPEKDKIHITYSTSCQSLAKSQSKDLKYLNISQRCFVERGIGKLNVSFKINQYEVCIGDECPIKTCITRGRFEIDDPCSKNYSKQIDDKDFSFIIRKMYKYQKIFLLPKKGQNHNHKTPLNIWIDWMKLTTKSAISKNENKLDFQFENREAALAIKERGKTPQKLLVKRQIEANTDEAISTTETELNTIEAVSRDQGLQRLSDKDLLDFYRYTLSRINETKNYIDESDEGSIPPELQDHEQRLAKVIDELMARGINFEERVYVPCHEESLVQDKLTTKINKNAINYYIHRSGCFHCSKPVCDFDLENCSKISTIELPVYTTVFDFGFPGSYLPINATLNITLNDKCYLKVEFVRVEKNVSIMLFQCKLGNKTCKDLNIRLNFSIEFNNSYCIQMAFAFINQNKIHYATSQFCNKFATINFNEETFLRIEEEECHLNESRSFRAELEIFQDSSRVYNGVPVILPCSSGGYLVNPRTGVFVTGNWCRELLQGSDIQENGFSFLLKNLFDFTEDFLFQREFESDVSYPHPTYLRNNGILFRSEEDMIPLYSVNFNKQRKTRNGCDYTDPNMTTVTEVESTTIITEETTVTIRLVNAETEIISSDNDNISNSRRVIQSQRRQDGGTGAEVNEIGDPRLITNCSNEFSYLDTINLLLLFLSFYLQNKVEFCCF